MNTAQVFQYSLSSSLHCGLNMVQMQRLKLAVTVEAYPFPKEPMPYAIGEGGSFETIFSE
jgi:hypothetical protein